MVIAIDGPAASGKGTLARRLAAYYGLPHLDTGLLYRAVGAIVLAQGQLQDEAASVEAARTLDVATLDPEALRTAELGEAASVVAARGGVRAALLDLQHRFAAQPGGAVLDGRDIGTVICPKAQAKLFVTASPEVRAERRHRELIGRGEDVAYETVLADIRKRDERDSARAAAPLVQADDAVLLDTSALDIAQAFAAALAIVEARRAGR
ncbi:cytidylate kinase [Xanthobacter versatilis]|uniref:Cytidylate kinase n=1 Tax=Xanthobacter autotrophicus (strain ATCC BAA-1158 / Py2) TaxID=78245 RepID=KCY_XANP2|nr:RecName: Full=Cytidylate kinase; Short=CK; AltName: Full=Cytidine monophosphate kinase; Short=CMP kinase [Xanthobacter autotrophicus Py2]ABS66360.1 cytidylate kinase [Xanthobacter autotrophicus Py2]